MNPSPVVSLNRVVAVSKVRGASEALAMLEPLSDALDGYFCFHGVRGALLAQTGETREAREAFGRAIALARSPAEAAHVRQELDKLKEESLASGRLNHCSS